jgi:hypothetical protein
MLLLYLEVIVVDIAGEGITDHRRHLAVSNLRELRERHFKP